jgi:hypothetical protein
VHTLGGWPLITAKGDLLRGHVKLAETALNALATGAGLTSANAARFADEIARRQALERSQLADARPALAAWDEAVRRFAPAVGVALARAEEVGRANALRVLDDAQIQVIVQMRRYLVGFDDTIFAADELKFPRTVRLKPSVPASGLTAAQDPVGDLRTKAHELARVLARERAADTFAALTAAATAAAGLGVLLVAGAAALTESATRGLKLAAYRNGLAAEHPVLHRLELAEVTIPGRTSPPTDAELQTGLQEVFATTWRAAREVRAGVVATVWDESHEQHKGGPSTGLAAALRDRGMNGGLASLYDPAYGPWAFQPVMAGAASDLAGPGQSVVSQAVHDVYESIDPSLGREFGEMVALTGALATLHLVAPPVAVVADVMLAAKGIIEALLAFLRSKAAYQCTLDPAASLAASPSMLRLALQCAGEVAGALSGGKIATSVSLLSPLAAGLVP